MVTSSIMAIIPARAGSKRIPRKNTRYLGGKPLIVWTIEAAKESGIFDRIMVCSDDLECLDIASVFEVAGFERYQSVDDEADIEWVMQVMSRFTTDAFAILRPTSPFRTAETIRRAWQHFLANQPCDSLRAVEPVKQHPGKMWVARGNRLLPLLPWVGNDAPWHSSATQTLPPVWAQNGSLEIVWTRTVTEQGTISGTNVLPFYTEANEGYDLNTLEDWDYAERIVQKGIVCQ